MKTGIGSRAQARCRAGVGGNLRLDEDNVHRKLSAISYQLSAFLLTLDSRQNRIGSVLKAKQERACASVLLHVRRELIVRRARKAGGVFPIFDPAVQDVLLTDGEGCRVEQFFALIVEP